MTKDIAASERQAFGRKPNHLIKYHSVDTTSYDQRRPAAAYRDRNRYRSFQRLLRFFGPISITITISIPISKGNDKYRKSF